MHPPSAELDARLGFLISAVLALAIVFAVAAANGGVTGLLTVGEDSPIRPFIEADLGNITLANGDGHDGQQYYGIARDPLGTGEVPDLVDNPSYRYLHILYPALAGGFGLFSPTATVWLMTALAVLGFALAGGAALRIADQLGGTHPVAGLALVNIGLLLAVRFLLPDALALALALIGVSLALDGRDRPAGVALALGVLAKTTYIVFPLALGLWVWQRDRSRTVWLTMLPVLPAALWTTYVFGRFGASTAGNLAAPFTGLVNAVGLWSDVSTGEVAMAIGALLLVAVGAALAAVARIEVLRWLLFTWVGVGLVSSQFVWEFGNNTLRVLAPLWSLAAVAGSLYLSSRRSRKNLPV